jgi:nuclear cap-binding protein subunit 1
MLHSITEQPFKMPYTSILFSLIAQHPAPSDGALETSAASPAKPLFQELCKGFQTSLDRLAWRDLRLTVRVSINALRLPHLIF